MKGDWVPFHKRLAKGPKKSIPRGVRFVLLELSLEARPTQGVIDLPLDWDTLDAVHDLIGGDRREVRKALTIFQIPDSTGAQVIKIERDQSQHRLKILKWDEWAGPKSDAERKQLSRKRQLESKELEELQDPKRDMSGQSDLAMSANVTPTIHNRTGQDKTEEIPQTPKGDVEYPGVLAIAIRGYAAGIRAITKQHWAFPDRPEERKAIAELVALYAPGAKGDRLEAKMTALASSYCEANKDRGRFEGGFRPTKCLEWVNSGSDTTSGTYRTVGSRRAERTAAVQLADLARAEGEDR